jgi:salicylate hydroxylase
MARHPVVIAGAGIAGLTAAIAFARQGLPVLLVEKRTGFEEVGAGIQLSPNASRILRALGVSALARHAVAMEQMDIRRWAEPRSFAEMAMSNANERYGAPFWTVRRADLQTALLDTARSMPGITLLVDRSVTGFAAREDGFEVSLKRGSGQSETLASAFLVGADGLWSSLRHAMGHSTRPVFSGYEAWRTLIRADAAPAFMRQPRIALWMGHGRHGVHYPVSAGAEINLVLVRKATISPAALEEWSLPPIPREIASLGDNAAIPLKHLIAAAPSWRRWPLFDSPPVTMGSRRIADGRVALIGDAAHAVLPFMAQGAALGIEDAYELASMIAPALGSEMSRHRHDAIARFNASRLPRATRLHHTARRNGARYHMGKPWSLARDSVIRHLGSQGMLARHDWIYGWKPEGS